MGLMRRTAATAAVAGCVLVGGMAAPASAAPPVAPGPILQEGLVNVAIGDVTILENVNLGVGLNVAANVCGVDVVVLASDLADDGTAECDARNGRIVQVTDQS